MTNIAVILAGGTGSRMGAGLPKQFRLLEGKPVIAHSIEAFNAAPDIDEVAVVAHRDWIEHTRTLIAEGGWEKARLVLEGGSERYLSSLAAIEAFLDRPDDTNLILHDAARPWISPEVIARVAKALQTHEAVAVGIPSTDTVWEVHPDLGVEVSHFIARIPERRLMWRAQTPQAFRLPLIRDAYQRAMQDPALSATDDCGVVRKYIPGTKIYVVKGEEGNRKITFPEDMCPSSSRTE